MGSLLLATGMLQCRQETGTCLAGTKHWGASMHVQAGAEQAWHVSCCGRNARVYGVSEAAPGERPQRVEAVLGGKRDPGYWDTARMLLEAGLCLALQVRQGDLAAVPRGRGVHVHSDIRNSGGP